MTEAIMMATIITIAWLTMGYGFHKINATLTQTPLWFNLATWPIALVAAAITL